MATYAVIEFWNPTVRDGEPRGENQVDEGVNVALFREVDRQPALFVVPRPLEVCNNIA
jgi:hypothetical protein